MSVIQIETPSPDRALPVLHDATERQLRLLSQSVGRTEANVKELAEKPNIVRRPYWVDIAIACIIIHNSSHFCAPSMR